MMAMMTMTMVTAMMTITMVMQMTTTTTIINTNENGTKTMMTVMSLPFLSDTLMLT